MCEIVTRITEGDGRPGDIEILEELSEVVREGSLCALGGTAPNPVMSTIRYFREEYQAHIHDKTCPAKQCKALISYLILPEVCTGCTACARVCPTNCIAGVRDKPHEIQQGQCIKCGSCYEVCPVDAILIA